MIDTFDSGEQEQEPGLVREDVHPLLDCADSEWDNCSKDVAETREG